MINQNTLKIFDDLYDKTYKNVLKYVVCNCSNAEDIKDIIQNIYMEVLKKIQKEVVFNNESAYIMGIAKNKVNEYYRHKYKVKIISLFAKRDDEEVNIDIPDSFDLELDYIKKEDINFIWDFLKKKKIIIFKVFYLYYYEDLSIENISKALNISQSNVKHYLYRTINELKEVMKERTNKNEK